MLSDQVDVGAKLLSGAAAQADVRVGLVRAPSLQSELDLTLAPSVLLGFSPAAYQQYRTLEVSLALLSRLATSFAMVNLGVLWDGYKRE